MSAVKIDLANPFFKPNPYYVPQRYYSHEKVNLSTHNHYSPYKSIVRDDYSWAQNNQHLVNGYKNGGLNASRRDLSRKEGQALKRKNINSIENPFHRKYLIPNTEIETIQEEYSLQAAEGRYLRARESRKVEQQPILENNFVKKMPSLKSLPSERDRQKENRLSSKHLSSQLKLKLKSQAQLQPLPPVASTLSGGRSREAMITLGRLQPSIRQRTSIEDESFPQTIFIRNKQFYKQTIL